MISKSYSFVNSFKDSPLQGLLICLKLSMCLTSLISSSELGLGACYLGKVGLTLENAVPETGFGSSLQLLLLMLMVLNK